MNKLIQFREEIYLWWALIGSGGTGGVGSIGVTSGGVFPGKSL